MGQNSRHRKKRNSIQGTDPAVPTRKIIISKKTSIISRIIKSISVKKISPFRYFQIAIKKISPFRFLQLKLKILKSGFTKRVFWGIGAIVATMFLLYIFTYKKSGYINGNVIFQGTTHFSYNNSQRPDSGKMRISPLCGCLIDHPHRGVEFFSKSFDLNSDYGTDSISGTQYFVTCPDQNMTYNPMYYFKAKIYFIDSSLYDYHSGQEVRNIISNPTAYNKKKGPFQNRIGILDSISCDTIKLLNILTYENKLHFELLGSYPIAAFIPMKNSDISIIKENLNNYTPFSNYYMEEKFLKDTINPWELPMLDALGPEIVISCKPDNISINGIKYEMKKINKNATSCIILLEVGFQVRVAQNKVSKKFQKILDTTSLKWVTNVTNYEGNSKIFPIPLDDTEFKALKKRVDTTGLVNGRARWLGTNMYTVNWGLPKLSKFNGVYFYGQNLSKVNCEEATGVCQYGNTSYHFDPSRKIEVKNLQDFKFDDEPVITPVSYNLNSDFSTKFRGKGELYLDDELVTESFLDSKLFSYTLIVLSLLSSIATLIMYFQDLTKVKTNPI